MCENCDIIHTYIKLKDQATFIIYIFYLHISIDFMNDFSLIKLYIF